MKTHFAFVYHETGIQSTGKASVKGNEEGVQGVFDSSLLEFCPNGGSYTDSHRSFHFSLAVLISSTLQVCVQVTQV